MITDEIETSDTLFVFNTEESTNFFNELTSFVSDIEQMHKHTTY